MSSERHGRPRAAVTSEEFRRACGRFATGVAIASVVDAKGATLRVVKGAYAAVCKQTGGAGPAAAEQELEAKGFRVLGVALGAGKALRLAGVIALSDPPRADAAELIKELGIRDRLVVSSDTARRSDSLSNWRGWPLCRSPHGHVPLTDASLQPYRMLRRMIPVSGQCQNSPIVGCSS